MSNDYIVKPVVKALQVLECLSEARRGMPLTEVCHQTSLPKTTAFRYLTTLKACGFVLHDPVTDLYRVSLRVWELGLAADERLRLREIALPAMQELRNQFNETVNLGVMEEREVVYVEAIESRHSLMMQMRPGSRDPVYSTALGKAMLAFLPEEQWSRHIPARLTARTDRTITSESVLKEELRLTRRRGYALDQGENEEGAYCVSAPIIDQRGEPLAAISLSGPASRLRDGMLAEVAAAIMAATAAISRQIT